MIITKHDFFEMGFTADEKDHDTLENCIKRAEFVLDGLTNGRASIVAQTGGAAADYVKQAAAFQTNALLREELAYAEKRGALSQSERGSSSVNNEERISIGDFSYSTGKSESSSSSTYERTSEDNDNFVKPLDHDKTVIRLLRAAGCLYGGTEVLE